MIKKYKVLRPIAWGGRQERGTEVEMDDQEAANIGDTYLEEVGSVTPVETPTDTPLEKMTVAQLKQLAASKELSTAGTKADLLERIQLAQDQEEEAENGDDKDPE